MGRANRLREVWSAFLAVAFAVCLTACSDSSASSSTHTADEFKAASIRTTSADVYADTFTGEQDYIASADSTLTFADGSTEANNIQLHFVGIIEDQPGSCVFSLDDDRDAHAGVLDDPNIIRKCDGRTEQTFPLGDLHLQIIGEVRTENDLEIFHVDHLRGGGVVNFNEGHSPKDDDHSNG